MTTVFLGYYEEGTLKSRQVAGPQGDWPALLDFARAGKLPDHPAVTKLAVDVGDAGIIKGLSFKGDLRSFEGSMGSTGRGDPGGLADPGDLRDITLLLRGQTWYVLADGAMTELSKYKTPEEQEEEEAIRLHWEKFSKPYRITTTEEMTDFLGFLQHLAEEDPMRIELSYGYPKLITETLDDLEDYLKIAGLKGSSVGSIVQVDYAEEVDYDGWNVLVAAVKIILGS